MVSTCAVYGCWSKKCDKSMSFHRFPKDVIRCRQWVKACCRIDLHDKSALHLNKSYVICDVHFDMSSRISNRLTHDAIPTLKLPDLPQEDSKSAIVKPEEPAKFNVYTQTVEENQPDKGFTCSEFQDSNITPQLQSITDLQKKIHDHSHNRYTKEFKLFALSVYFAGPMTYRVLSKIIRLPSEETLSKININTGTKISPYVIKCLESKLKHLKESQKYCVICADEIPLKRHLFYQINLDKVVGLHEIDEIQTAEPATQAFVLMARGIFQNWKQPLGYSFLAQSKNYFELNTWLVDMIAEVIHIGFKVVAFVSDHSSNFLNLANSWNVTVKNPYFFINGHKIYYIFDIPQLVTSFRNYLLKYDIEYQNDDGTIAAAWTDIKTFYAQDNNRVYRLAPKLTESHIEPKNLEKIKVKYATQVFSKTVATGMSVSIELGLLNHRCIGTVKLIDLINNTFDILNSSPVRDPNKFKKPFAGLPYQIETLNQFAKFINDITIRNTENEKDFNNCVEFIKGFKISIQSIMSMQQDLNSRGYKSVYTRRLNQEVMENVFGSVRRHSNCRKLTTPIKFSRAFRKLFIANLLKPLKNVNSDEDIDVSLGKLVSEHVVKQELAQHDSDPLITVNRTDYRFDVPEDNAFHQVCGYLLRACHDIHKCEGIDAYVKLSEHLKTGKNGIEHNAKDKRYELNPPDEFVYFIKELDNCVVNVFSKKLFLRCLGNEMLEAQSNIAFVACCPCFPTDYLKKLFVRFRIFNVVRYNNRLLKVKSLRNKYFYVPNL